MALVGFPGQTENMFPCHYIPARSLRDLDARVLAQDPTLTLSDMPDSCPPTKKKNPLNSEPWTCIGMVDTLKARVAVFMRWEQLCLILGTGWKWMSLRCKV